MTAITVAARANNNNNHHQMSKPAIHLVMGTRAKSQE